MSPLTHELRPDPPLGTAKTVPVLFIFKFASTTSNVGSPATPAGFIIDTFEDPAVKVLAAQESVAVLAPKPVPVTASKPARSFAKAKVGSPATPAGLLMVKPAAGAVKVLCAHASLPVLAANPVDPSPSSAARSLANAKTILSTRYTKRSLTKEERDYRMPEMNISNLTTQEIIRELEIVYPASALAKMAAVS